MERRALRAQKSRPRLFGRAYFGSPPPIFSAYYKERRLEGRPLSSSLRERRRGLWSEQKDVNGPGFDAPGLARRELDLEERCLTA